MKSTPMRHLVLLGPPGSFSDIALKKLRGQWKKRYVTRISDIGKQSEKMTKTFRNAVRGANTVSVLVPLRNKIAGGVLGTAPFLNKKRWTLKRSFKIAVHLELAAPKAVRLLEVREIFAPRIVFDQCRKFLSSRFPHAILRPHSYSSSYMFKKIVQFSKKKAEGRAVIGAESAAKKYGLHVLARNIQDDANDWTEFGLFERHAQQKRSAMKKARAFQSRRKKR